MTTIGWPTPTVFNFGPGKNEVYIVRSGLTVVNVELPFDDAPWELAAIQVSSYSRPYPSGSAEVQLSRSADRPPLTVLPSGFVITTVLRVPAFAVIVTGSTGDTSLAPLWTLIVTFGSGAGRTDVFGAAAVLGEVGGEVVTLPAVVGVVVGVLGTAEPVAEVTAGVDVIGPAEDPGAGVPMDGTVAPATVAVEVDVTTAPDPAEVQPASRAGSSTPASRSRGRRNGRERGEERTVIGIAALLERGERTTDRAEQKKGHFGSSRAGDMSDTTPHRPAPIEGSGTRLHPAPRVRTSAFASREIIRPPEYFDWSPPRECRLRRVR